MKLPIIVGGDVHYVSSGSADGHYPAVCRAAKITSVGENDWVSLVVFNPEGLHFNLEIPYDEGHDVRTWHWPCGGSVKSSPPAPLRTSRKW